MMEYIEFFLIGRRGIYEGEDTVNFSNGWRGENGAGLVSR
jgi:hypothetical protein